MSNGRGRGAASSFRSGRFAASSERLARKTLRNRTTWTLGDDSMHHDGFGRARQDKQVVAVP